MKILMLGFGENSSGVGEVCRELSGALTKEKIDVTLCMPQKTEQNMEQVTPSQQELLQRLDQLQMEVAEDSNPQFSPVATTTITVDSPLTPYLNQQTFTQQSPPLSSNPKKRSQDKKKEIADLQQELNRFSLQADQQLDGTVFDLIHAHDWPNFLLGSICRYKTGAPLVVHLHSTEFDRHPDGPDPQVVQREREGLHQADRIITVSHRTKKILIERYQVPEHKVSVIHNAVESTPLVSLKPGQALFPEKKSVVYLGRLTAQKGPLYFIQTAHLLLKKMPNLQFIMAGSGQLSRQELERQDGRVLPANFHFTGHLDQKRKRRLLASADLLLMPSISDPFGITALEAAKYQVPLVVSKQSGATEALPQAITCDFWDVQQCAQLVEKLLTTGEEASSTIQDNHRQVTQKDWQLTARLVKKLYEQLVN